MLLVGCAGFYIPQLRDVEKILPDHDTTEYAQFNSEK
jgi:hypothetical protein